MADYLLPTYNRLPVAFARGEGVWLWDTQDNQYLDALSGIGVCGLGHAHPAVTQALCQQAGTLIHTSNLYRIPLQEELARELGRISSMEGVFFCNSGAEAVEAAIKLARLHGHRRGITDPAIIVADNSFHGRTLATLTATGNRKVQDGFEPLVQGFIRASYNDLETLRTIAGNTQNVVAVLVEPIQGEGGINIPAPEYLPGLRALCDEQGWLLMLDEVQTGLCRTGRWFAYQHHGVQPDVVSLAKGLGNGVPIGACLARGEAARLFQPGDHGSTFGGNPLACSAALAVIKTLDEEQLAARAETMGGRLLKGLEAALGTCRMIREIRGQGLMIGIELDRPCTNLVNEALGRGLLFSVQGERVIRLLPPLIINEAEGDQMVEIVSSIIRDFEESPA